MALATVTTVIGLAGIVGVIVDTCSAINDIVEFAKSIKHADEIANNMMGSVLSLKAWLEDLKGICEQQENAGLRQTQPLQLALSEHGQLKKCHDVVLRMKNELDSYKKEVGQEGNNGRQQQHSAITAKMRKGISHGKWP